MVYKWMMHRFSLEDARDGDGERCMAFLCIPFSIRKFFLSESKSLPDPTLWNMNSRVSCSSNCSVTSPNMDSRNFACHQAGL